MPSASPSRTVPSSTNGRKRSHDQVSQSQNRSTSTEPLSKRLRTHRTSASPSLSAPPRSSPPARPQRHGYDFRRPVMASRELQDTIDLTQDDDNDSLSSFDSPQPTVTSNSRHAVDGMSETDMELGGMDDFALANAEIIALSDDEEAAVEVPGPGPGPSHRRASSDSEILFLGTRPVEPPPLPDNHHHNVPPNLHNTGMPQTIFTEHPRVPSPTMYGLPLGGVSSIIRRSAQLMMNWNTRVAVNRPEPVPVAATNDGDLEVLELDYGRAAFNMGIRDSETPSNAPGAPYKELPPLPEGFSGDTEEDGIYLCPRCEEELATGETEEKQQVWVVKQCGHVYCGDCARARALVKEGKKEKRNAKTGVTPFRLCSVDSCNTKVTGKHAMLQVYL